MANKEPLDDESLGQYIRRLREATGLSQRDLIAELNGWPERHRFSAGWLHRLESDAELKQHGPPIAYLEALAGVLSAHLSQPVSVNALRRLAGYQVIEDIVDDEVLAALHLPEMRDLMRAVAPLSASDREAILRLAQHFRELRGIDPMPIFPDDPNRPDYQAVEEGKEELGL